MVLLPFPFTDLRITKQRPAVVISSEAFNTQSPDVVVVAVTSQLPATLSPGECRLSDENQRAAGLPKPSIVKCGKLLTIDQRLIRKTLGRLPPGTLDRIKQQIVTLLG